MKDSKFKSKLIYIYEYLYEKKQCFEREYTYRKQCHGYRLKIISCKKTIKYIEKNKCSIARFGDGEFDMISRTRDLKFQNNSEELSEQLIKTLQNNNPKLLLCVPGVLNSIKGCNYHAAMYWQRWAFEEGKHHKTVDLIHKYVRKNYRFGDAQITRPYIDWRTPKRAKVLFPMLKKLWENKDIIVVEGEQTRLGVGNDLFSECKSIKRILAPAENAFKYYEKIKYTLLNHYQNELVITALGPTATVLASELTNVGIQVLDIGHIDVEYEWFLAGVHEKTIIKGKYINEVIGGQEFSECLDEQYQKEIIARVGC